MKDAIPTIATSTDPHYTHDHTGEFAEILPFRIALPDGQSALAVHAESLTGGTIETRPGEPYRPMLMFTRLGEAGADGFALFFTPGAKELRYLATFCMDQLAKLEATGDTRADLQ